MQSDVTFVGGDESRELFDFKELFTFVIFFAGYYTVEFQVGGDMRGQLKPHRKPPRIIGPPHISVQGQCR